MNPFDTAVPLEMRPDGYPARLPLGTIAHKLVMRDVQLHAMPGRYVCLYDGDGRLDFKFDARVVSRRVELGGVSPVNGEGGSEREGRAGEEPSCMGLRHKARMRPSRLCGAWRTER